MDMTGAVEGGARQIEEDAPELEALLSQFHSSLKEVRSRIGPLVKEVSPSPSLWQARPPHPVIDILHINMPILLAK